MTHIFTIHEDTVIIDKLVVADINGNLTITGDTKSYGSFNIIGDITTRNITADVLKVKQLISETTEFGNWHATTFDELNGKGITWTCDEGSTQLIYRTNNRIWTNSNIDLAPQSSFMIDNISVLSTTSLGQTVTKSNLRQVGALTALSVIGSASISGFAFFDEHSNRFGLGTSEPNAALSIVDNNVEISIGSPISNLAYIGTQTNHDLALISDGTPRITIKQSGEIIVGNDITKSGVLRVYGSIYADSIVSDTRITRTSSLEFLNTRSDTIFNKGLVWNSTEIKELVLLDNPERLYTSESFEIAKDKSFMINNRVVLSETTLGTSVLTSSLTSLGNLNDLTVIGTTTLKGKVVISSNSLSTNSIQFKEDSSLLTINANSIISENELVIKADNTNMLYGNDEEIIIGEPHQPDRPVKVFGTLAVGINNPDTSVKFSVNGDVSFNNKKFVNGTNIPTSGVFSKGDICWNQDPTITGYVGWICVVSGTPGEWKPFGAIGA